jgi:hypothetical protein
VGDCKIEDDAGNPADIRTGDIVTSNGGMLGLGHAGVIERRGDSYVVVEVMLAADGSVHVQERDLCKFLDDYAAQKREVFISRPRKPAATPDDEWAEKLERVVDYMKQRICTRYPVWDFFLDTLFHMPEVWYCSDLVREAFRREGIELELTVPPWHASDDRETRDFLFARRGEMTRRWGDTKGERFIRGFTLPPAFTEPLEPKRERPPRLAANLDAMVEDQLWTRQLTAMAAYIDREYDLAAASVKRRG